jgi:hypothetical protein
VPTLPLSAETKLAEDIRMLAEGGQDEGIDEGEAHEVKHDFGDVFHEGFSNHSVDYDARSRLNIKKKINYFSEASTAVPMHSEVSGSMGNKKPAPFRGRALRADRPP